MTGPSTAPQYPRMTGRRRWLALVVVLSAVFMQLLDTTIVTVAIPSIQADLRTSFGLVQLVLAGYSLTFACTLITGGRLGDSYGRRRLFLIGMIGFVVSSALCGAAPNGITLVVARLAQGMCSGLMFPRSSPSSPASSTRRAGRGRSARSRG